MGMFSLEETLQLSFKKESDRLFSAVHEKRTGCFGHN